MQLFFTGLLIALGAAGAIGGLGYLLDESLDALERDRSRTRRGPSADSNQAFAPGELPQEHSGTIG